MLAHTTVAIDEGDLNLLKYIADKDKRTIKTSLGILIQDEYSKRTGQSWICWQENKMTQYTKTESDYISGKDLVGVDGVTFKVTSEVKDEPSQFGVKPKCTVEVTMKGVVSTRHWTLNQQNINYFVDTFGGDSNAWIGKIVGVYTENIKGNQAIRVRGV